MLVKTPERVVLTAMEKSLFRPPEESSPGRTFQQLAALLVQAGHAAAGLDQVIVAEAVPYEDVPGAYQVLVTGAAPDALSAEQRCEGLAAAHHAQQVDVDDPLPVGQADVGDAAHLRDAGVVDHHVHPAPGLLQPVGRGLQVGLARDVAMQIVHRPAMAGQGLHGLRALGVVHIAQADRGALLRKELGQRPAQARSPSGDEDAQPLRADRRAHAASCRRWKRRSS